MMPVNRYLEHPYKKPSHSSLYTTCDTPFRHNVEVWDMRCLATSIPNSTFCDAAHVVPHGKGDMVRVVRSLS